MLAVRGFKSAEDRLDLVLRRHLERTRGTMQRERDVDLGIARADTARRLVEEEELGAEGVRDRDVEESLGAQEARRRTRRSSACRSPRANTRRASRAAREFVPRTGPGCDLRSVRAADDLDAQAFAWDASVSDDPASPARNCT